MSTALSDSETVLESSHPLKAGTTGSVQLNADRHMHVTMRADVRSIIMRRQARGEANVVVEERLLALSIHFSSDLDGMTMFRVKHPRSC